MSTPVIDAASPFKRDDRGVRVALKVTPRAARDRIGEVAYEADGQAVLKMSVTAAPERGRANAAVVRLLSKAWRIPKTRIEIMMGAADRRKALHVSGDPESLLEQLSEWVNGDRG